MQKVSRAMSPQQGIQKIKVHAPGRGPPAAGARSSLDVGPGEGDTLRPQRDALGLRSRVPLI